MPRKFSFRQTTQRGDERSERAYTITYLDDDPDRREAVAFFTARSPGQKSAFRSLLPYIELPREVETMSPENAQAYLDSHPMHQRWQMLNVVQTDLICDDDLARLRHIPEIEYAKIISSRITDRGVKHLCYLSNLRSLFLYSRKVTNACLVHIGQMKTLETLDLQMSPFVSRSAFTSTTAQLPSLRESFPPWRWPLTAIIRWFYAEWRIQQKQRAIARV